jgi:aromatic-L-amino-acid decarboxylase
VGPPVAPGPRRSLRLLEDERIRLWEALSREIEGYLRGVGDLRVEPIDPSVDPTPFVEAFDFDRASEPLDVLARIVDGLRRYQVHTPHPGYYGLFNPAPTTMGIAADAIVAAFNPQLATFSHSPFAVAAERHVLRALGSRFFGKGVPLDGTFCSGGAEANHTALLAALATRFPAVRDEGLRALPGQPTVYVTHETHHSIVKAARMAGLGTKAVREVPVDASLRMLPAALGECVARDRARGEVPFFVVGTAGTTSSGAIDPLDGIAGVARAEGLWFHVDAAWGGGAALVPELRPLLAGVERADSVTLDAHKWLSVPMGAGVFLTTHTNALEGAFSIAASYMPHPVAGAADPYSASMQWSRRFIGLKVLMSLAVAGWDGYAEALRHQTQIGERLRERLSAAGFRVVNDTSLPLVCFVDGGRPDGAEVGYLTKARNLVASSGEAWISVTRLGPSRVPVLRACITNFETTEEDLERLVARLLQARAAVGYG